MTRMAKTIFIFAVLFFKNFAFPARFVSHCCCRKALYAWIHICYLPAGRSVLGKTVPEVLSTAPRAVPRTEGTVFPDTDRPRPANNVFIIFFRKVLCKQFLCWIFTAAIFKPGARVRIAVVIWIHNFLFLISLFTFYVLCSEKKNCWKRRESWKISSGPYAGSGWENPGRWSARN